MRILYYKNPSLMKLTPRIGQRFQFGGFLMSKYLLKTKLEAVDLYQRGFGTKEIQEKLHIPSRRSIDGWINNYQQYGNRGLEKAFLRQDIVVNLN